MTDLIEQPLSGIENLPAALSQVDAFLGHQISSIISGGDFDGCVDAIEAHLADRGRFGLCGADCEMNWTHSNGVSVKEMILSPMAIVTGSEHKIETINTVTNGSVVVFTKKGYKYFVAGDVFISMPGIRKLGITFDGVSFTNAFPNPENERDEDKLDDLYFEPAKDHERVDEFECFKRISGLDQDTIDDYMITAGEPIPLPCGSMKLGDSDIDGTGVFATKDILKGEHFPVFSMLGERTILARYSNHSFKPDLVLEGMYAIALRDIEKGEEVTMNYLDNLMKTKQNGGLECLAQ